MSLPKSYFRTKTQSSLCFAAILADFEEAKGGKHHLVFRREFWNGLSRVCKYYTSWYDCIAES